MGPEPVSAFATYGPWVGALIVSSLGTLLSWVTLRAKVVRDNKKDAAEIENKAKANELALEEKKLQMTKVLMDERSEFTKELRTELSTVRDLLAKCEADRRVDFATSEAQRKADREAIDRILTGQITLQDKYEDVLKKMPSELAVPAAIAAVPVVLPE